MKIKHLLLAAICSASALSLAAQSQGYLDGIEYYKADQFDNAREILERTLNDNGTDQATACYYLGAIALRDGKPAEASAYFRKGTEINPKNGLNFAGLGAVALAEGNTGEATTQFKAATKAQNNAPVNVAIARAYYDVDPVAYVKEYDKYMATALKKDKNSPDYYIMRGDKLLAAGDVGGAAASYEMASHLNPGTPIPEAYVKYATAYIHANPKFAIDKLKELNQLAPSSALAQRELAEKYYDNDQLTRAAEQYGIYIQNPNHFIQDEERYVQLLYFGQKYDQSFDLASQILAKNPASFPMKRMQFLNKAAMEQYPEAKELAEVFFATVPPANNRFTANDYTTYGSVLTKLDEDSLAIIAYEKAIAVNPEKVELLKELSGAHYHAKNYPAAADAFQRFIDSGEGTTNDIYTLAGRWMSAISYYDAETQAEERAAAAEKALANINTVLERVDNDPRIPQRKARILIVANNNEVPQEAVDCYESAIAIIDADPASKEKRADIYREALTYIAIFYVKEHDTEKAKTYYERVYEMDPTNEALRQYIDNLK